MATTDLDLNGVMGPTYSFSPKTETEALPESMGYFASGLQRIEHKPIYRVGLSLLTGLFAGVWR